MPGSGVRMRKPRISPPGNCVLWMLRYAFPEFMPEMSVAIATLTSPPFAARKAGLYDVGARRSRVLR